MNSPAAAVGVTNEHTGTEPLVGVRYFWPEAQENAPNVGDHKKGKK